MKLLAPLSVKSGTVWLRKVIALIRKKKTFEVNMHIRKGGRGGHPTQNTLLSHTGAPRATCVAHNRKVNNRWFLQHKRLIMLMSDPLENS